MLKVILILMLISLATNLRPNSHLCESRPKKVEFLYFFALTYKSTYKYVRISLGNKTMHACNGNILDKIVYWYNNFDYLAHAELVELNSFLLDPLHTLLDRAKTDKKCKDMLNYINNRKLQYNTDIKLYRKAYYELILPKYKYWVEERIREQSSGKAEVSSVVSNLMVMNKKLTDRVEVLEILIERLCDMNKSYEERFTRLDNQVRSEREIEESRQTEDSKTLIRSESETEQKIVEIPLKEKEIVFYGPEPPPGYSKNRKDDEEKVTMEALDPTINDESEIAIVDNKELINERNDNELAKFLKLGGRDPVSDNEYFKTLFKTQLNTILKLIDLLPSEDFSCECESGNGVIDAVVTMSRDGVNMQLYQRNRKIDVTQVDYKLRNKFALFMLNCMHLKIHNVFKREPTAREIIRSSYISMFKGYRFKEVKLLTKVGLST